jgi:hypothetical protein
VSREAALRGALHGVVRALGLPQPGDSPEVCEARTIARRAVGICAHCSFAGWPGQLEEHGRTAHPGEGES